MRGDDQQSRLLYDLCALLLAGLRSPPPHAPAPGHRPARLAPVSPAGLASFLLGASLTMMLCGSMTFLIGFLLLPWVIALVTVLYLVGVVSNLSGLGRALLCRSPKEMSDQFFSKLPNF